MRAVSSLSLPRCTSKMINCARAIALSGLILVRATVVSVSKPAPLERGLIALSGLNQTGQSLYGSPASGATDFHEFGTSVSLDVEGGTRLAVGAPLLDWNSSKPDFLNDNEGGVFFYELNVVTERWDLLWLLRGAQGEEVGRRLSLSHDGSIMAVRRESSVELYQTTPQRSLLVDPILSTGGATVALSSDGRFLAVSEESFRSNTGQVRLLEVDGSADVAITGVTPQGRFGWATSFSSMGDRIAISAPNFANDDRQKRGLVRVYEKTDDNGGWVRLGQNIVGSEDTEQFGFSLALSSDGTTLAIGSPGHSGGGALRGKVTIYKLQEDTSRWLPFGDFIAGDADDDRFGRSVAISRNGTRIIASSFFHNGTRGHVKMYDYHNQEDKWTQIEEINGQENIDRLGFAVSMTCKGDRIAVGSVRARDPASGFPTGKVQVFDIQVYPDVTHTVSSAPSGRPSSEASVTPSHVASTTPSALPSLSPSALSGPSVIPSKTATSRPSVSIESSVYPSTSGPAPSSPYLTPSLPVVRRETGGDEFGAAVGLASSNATRLVVGAPRTRFNETEDGDDDPEGAVFVYDIGSDSAWNHVWTFQGNSREELGSRLSVSADGSRVVLRRRQASSSVEVYDISVPDAPFLLYGPIPSLTGGDTVTLSSDGKFVAVSQETHMANVGRVDLYSLEGDGNWTEIGSLFGNARTARFGWATSFSKCGRRIAISAPNFIGSGMARLGLVKVFERIGSNSDWRQIGQTLTGSEGGEQFGFSMELSGEGTHLVVASPGHSGGGALRGKVETFKLLQNETWVSVGSPVLGANDGDRFGRSVAIDETGTRIAATSYFHESERGHVRMYELHNGDSWRTLDEINGLAEKDRFGFGVQGLSMLADGSRVAVGSLRTNGVSVGSVVTLDVIDPSLVPSAPPSAVPSASPTGTDEVPILGCLCDANRNCLSNAAQLGNVTLCLRVNAFNVSFVGIEQLRIVPEDMDGAYFMPIVDGSAQIAGTTLDLEGSNCYVHTTLLGEYFVGEGAQEAEARGIALLRVEDGRRALAELDISGTRSLFAIQMKVESTTSGVYHANGALVAFTSLILALVVTVLAI